jgi:hypothetical protein
MCACGSLRAGGVCQRGTVGIVGHDNTMRGCGSRLADIISIDHSRSRSGGVGGQRQRQRQHNEGRRRDDGTREKSVRVYSSQPDTRSAKPHDSTTGNIARMVKNAVPSFISSLTILPLLLATTAYTFPSTSAMTHRRQHADALIRKTTRWRASIRNTHSTPGCHRCTWRA